MKSAKSASAHHPQVCRLTALRVSPLFVEIKFDQRAVLAAGKGEDLKMMEGILKKIEDPDKRANYEKTDRQDMFFFKKPANYEKTYTEGASMWTCKCGTINYGKFCTECGSRRP